MKTFSGRIRKKLKMMKSEEKAFWMEKSSKDTENVERSRRGKVGITAGAGVGASSSN
jgi:hypothetical protein